MSETLSPCPCCRNNAALHDRGTGDSHLWWVECSVCGLRTSMEEAPEYATETWNRRTPIERTGTEERERLAEQMIAELRSTVRHPSQLDDDESMDDAIARIVHHFLREPRTSSAPERTGTQPEWDETRCRVCGWPLAASREGGCVAGDCSMRPVPKHRADGAPSRGEQP